MTVTYEEVRNKVRDLEFEEEFTIFECGGLEHFVCFSEEVQDSPGEYTPSAEWVTGTEITISGSIRGEFRKPVLLHEVAEFLLRESYTTDDGNPMYRKEDTEAHPIAREWDQRYARETLSERAFREYLEFCNRFD